MPSTDEDDAILDVWNGGGGGSGGAGGGAGGVDKTGERPSLMEQEALEAADFMVFQILRDWAMGTEFVERCRFGVLFYVALMPISALFAVLLR